MTTNRKSRKAQRRLLINAVLLLFSLAAFVVILVAWFTTLSNAALSGLNSEVISVQLLLEEEIEPIVFPCATKLGDETVTASLFDSEVAQVRTYAFTRGEEDDQTAFFLQGTPVMQDGVLAYVCDGVQEDGSGCYEELLQKLDGQDTSAWSYDDWRTALRKLNRRTTGEWEDGVCRVSVLYWVDYDEVEDTLQDGYQALTYTLPVTFTGLLGGASS